MKAYYVYHVLDPDEGEIVMADTPGQAKCRADCYDAGDFTGMRARRAPEFDGDGGPPTDRDYLQKGWLVPCARCGRNIYSEDDAHFDRHDRAYCSEACLAGNETTPSTTPA